MVKVFNPLFTIKIASPKIKREVKSSKISRRCLAVVISDNGTLKARIATSPVEDNQEYLVIPFTDNSYSLKGKTHVFLKHKDKYNNFVCVIRDTIKANFSPGTNSQYDAIKEGLLLAGRIIKIKEKLYFDYETLIAFSETAAHINEVNIKENTPLFNNEHKLDKSS